jgi:hypothetical protein
MISMTTNQMIAAAPMVVVDAPTLDHTETEERPNPVPSASKMSASAAVAAAPANTAGQDTPDALASLPLGPIKVRPDGRLWWESLEILHVPYVASFVSKLSRFRF